MIKALQLIFAPNATWNKIDEAKRGVLWVLLLSPLPLMLLGSLGEAYGLVKWGYISGELARSKPVLLSQDMALRFELVRLAGDLLVLFFGALLLHWFAESFNVAADFNAAFTTVAYSLGPWWLLRIADGVPYLSTWLCWGVGAVLVVHVFYHGVALAMRPDQTKGFGLMLSGAVGLLLLSGLVHFVATVLLKHRLWM